MTSYTFSLDNETEKYAKEVLGETSEKREQCISAIRKFLKENPKINGKNDDYSILAFLRGCKFNVEKTKAKMRNYYEMRARVTEWFDNRDPNLNEVKVLANLGVFLPIPLVQPGPLVVIIRTAAHNPQIHKQSDVFKTGKMILDLAVKEYECATIYGVYAIFDMKNVSFGHAKLLPPNVIRKAVFAWQNYHIRPQSLEFINAPIYINVVLNVFKSFMTKKLKQRVHVHFSGFDDLHKVVPKNQLPVEYGGTNGELQDIIDFWKKKLDENVEWFKNDEQYKSVID